LQVQTGGAFLKAKSTEFRAKTRVQHDDVHLIILSFYNHENRLHKAVFVVYGELSGGKQMSELKIEYLNINELIPYQKNPRYNENAVDCVASSIEEFGFKIPIVIDKDKNVVCGHTRLKAAHKLGIKSVPCIIADDLTEKQISAFRIADNKASDFSIWDNKLLLDEKDNDVIEENENGIIYEIVFKSENKSKIEKILEKWEEMQNE